MTYISRDCGLSLKMMSGIVCGIEVAFSVVVVTLVTVFWTMDHHHPKMFLYQAGLNDTYIKRQRSLEGCVISWSLCILLFLSLWRMGSALILFLGVRKDSVLMSQYWILFKILAMQLSMFVAVVSFTSPSVKPCALISLAVDVVTSYFIVLLFPELHRMKQGVPVPRT